jgi:excisionase family DNA binding protein
MHERQKNRLEALQLLSRRLFEDSNIDLDNVEPRQLVEGLFPTEPRGPKSPAEPERQQHRSSGTYMTVKEIAKDIDLHEKVVRRAIEAGELPATKVRNRIRVKRSDYEAWVEANKVEPYPVPELEP